MHNAWSKDKKNSKDGSYQNKDSYIAAATASSNGDTNIKDTAPKTARGLNDKLNQILVMNVCLSSEYIDKLFKEAHEK